MRIQRVGDRVLSIGGPRFVAPRGGAAGNGLLNALIAYWPGNEASGDLLDAHTNGLDLTDVNTVTSNTGLVYTTARQYTLANTEHHTRADEALLSTGDVDFTIATWCYADSLLAASMFIVMKGGNAIGSAGIEYTLYETGDRMRFLIHNCVLGGPLPFVQDTAPISIGVWYFVVGWHDSVADKIFISVNNDTPSELAVAIAPGDSTQGLGIGGVIAGSQAAWDGRIGPTMFWKSAAGGGGVLSNEKRSALYNAGNGLKYADFTA